MKMLIVIVLSLFVCTQGCAQTDGVEHNKGKKMKRYFDIKTFNENQDRSGNYRYTTYDMSIRQYSLYDSNRLLEGYVEDCRELHTPYSYYYRYDTRGRLRQMSVSFSGIHIGKAYSYDSLGRITEEKDYSAPYKFKLSDLIEKMKKEYGCDLLNKERVAAVSRSEGEKDLKRPWYSVYYLDANDDMCGDEYLIDGTTGETLYIIKNKQMDEWWDDIKYYKAIMNGVPMSIEEKYLYELKKKKEGQKKKGTKKNGKSFWRKFFD